MKSVPHLISKLLGLSRKQIIFPSTRRLLQEFRAHDFFLNESQKIAKVGSWLWDVSNNSIQWSDYLCEIFDVDHKNQPTTYEQYLSLIPANERELAKNAISEAFENKRAFFFEHSLVTKSGDVKILCCHGKVIIENGEIKAMIGTSQDITEQKQLEAALRRQKLEAENSNDAKSKFLANMSHEIRTPISAILGFSELLTDKSLLTQERISYLSLIRANANWLSELVENILDLAKIESGKIEFEKIKVDLTFFMTRIRDLVAASSRKELVPVEFELKGKLPQTFETDPTRLRQILINIIRNSQKFTHDGRIVVRVCLKQKPDPKIVFDVCDTGIGMTPAQQQKVFNPFMQADSSTTRKFGGTGLGLTLSKGLSQAIGGNLKIQRSYPGKGSVFRLELPLNEVGNLIEIRDLPDSPLGNGFDTDFLLANKKILIVDDSADNRDIIKRFLERAGAQVETAVNGQVAVEKLRDGSFDLVLMDIQMPVMDGVRATQEIRKTDSATPIIALTAQALQEERRSCMAAGFNDYLIKPISRRSLLEQVSQKLDSHYSFH